jgi:hypothetical protein
MNEPTPVEVKPQNRRAMIMLVAGIAVVLLFLAFKMFTGGGDTAAPTHPNTEAVATAPAATVAPKAAPAPVAAPGPAPNTTRDPFRALR